MKVADLATSDPETGEEWTVADLLWEINCNLERILAALEQPPSVNQHDRGGQSA